MSYSAAVNESYLSDFQAWHQASPQTVKLRMHWVGRLAKLGDLSTISAQEISQFMNTPNWSANTRASAFSALRKFFLWMQKVGKHRPDDPMDLVPKPKAQRGIPRPVPEDYLESARKKAKNAADLLMFNLAAMQGMRRAEIATLKVSDIDLSRDLLVIKGKGNKFRELPIHSSLRRDLETAIRKADGDYIFESPENPGHPLTPTTVGRRVSKMLGRKYTTHQLRHRFATAVYKSSGNDIRVTQELLGHASVATTQVYTAVSKESMRNAVSGV